MAKLLKGTTVGGKEVATIDDILVISDKSNAHIDNATIHITSAERTSWNAKAGGTHTHATSEITGLDTALAGKALTSHTHTIANVTGLQAAIDAKETPAGAQAKATLAETNAKTYADTKVAGLVSSAPAALDTLNELATALGNDPNFATSIATSIGLKADTTTFNTHVADAIKHVTAAERITWNAKASTAIATTTVDGLHSKADKVKLDGIAVGATNYVHPATHPASIIVQDASNRFMTDAERTKLTGIATGATNYIHPANHPASIITQDASNRFVTDAEKVTWNGKAAGVHTHATSEITGLDAKFTAIDTSFTGVTALINGKAPTSHAHVISNITGLQAEIDKQVLKTGDTMTGELKMNNKITFGSKFSMEYNALEDSLDFSYN